MPKTNKKASPKKTEAPKSAPEVKEEVKPTAPNPRIAEIEADLDKLANKRRDYADYLNALGSMKGRALRDANERMQRSISLQEEQLKSELSELKAEEEK